MTPSAERYPHLNLRQVRYFVVLAEELSFTRAATRLHISVPALSQQIKSLERQLEVQLLVRDTRYVGLTPAGTRFADTGRGLLDAGAAAVDEVRMPTATVGGQLNLACLHEADLGFEPLLARFHAEHPDVDVSVMMMKQAELVAAVEAGLVDAALTWTFLPRGDPAANLRLQIATATEVVAVLSSHSALADQDHITRGPALRETKSVMFERKYSAATFDYAVKELYGPGVTDPPVLELEVTVRAQEAMAQALDETDLLAPMLGPLAARLPAQLQVRPFSPPWYTHGCVIWHRARTPVQLTALLQEAKQLSTTTKASPLER